MNTIAYQRVEERRRLNPFICTAFLLMGSISGEIVCDVSALGLIDGFGSKQFRSDLLSTLLFEAFVVMECVLLFFASSSLASMLKQVHSRSFKMTWPFLLGLAMSFIRMFVWMLLTRLQGAITISQDVALAITPPVITSLIFFGRAWFLNRKATT